MLRTCVALFPVLLTGSCYLEGGGCSGPFCFSVSTDLCEESGTCNDSTSSRCPDADDIQSATIRELDRLRSTSTQCGSVAYPPAGRLMWSQALFQIADQHALDMATHNFVSANGSNGLGINERAGNQYSSVSQSVAAGFAGVSSLLSEWTRLPDDCAKMVSAEAGLVGLACRYDSDSQFGQYWTLVVAGQ